MCRSGVGLALKTSTLQKGVTFSSSTSPPSSPTIDFQPPSLPRRSQTNLDDVIDSRRRRVALMLGDIDKTLSSTEEPSSPACKEFRDTSLPIPHGILCHTIDSSIMGQAPEVARRVYRPYQHRVSRFHESDSGLGTSIISKTGDKTAPAHDVKSAKLEASKTSDKPAAVIRCGGSRDKSNISYPPLSSRATHRIYEHTLKPLLAEPSLRNFHPLVLECPRKIQEKEVVCLRDLEKTLLLLAPVRGNLSSHKSSCPCRPVGVLLYSLCINRNGQNPPVFSWSSA